MWPVECRLFFCSTVIGRTQVRELRSRPNAKSLAAILGIRLLTHFIEAGAAQSLGAQGGI